MLFEQGVRKQYSTSVPDTAGAALFSGDLAKVLPPLASQRKKMPLCKKKTGRVLTTHWLRQESWGLVKHPIALVELISCYTRAFLHLNFIKLHAIVSR